MTHLTLEEHFPLAEVKSKKKMTHISIHVLSSGSPEAPQSHRKVTRLHTLSGDIGLSASAQRRTFSFGGAMMSQSKTRRGLPRQKTISGDSAYSTRSSYRSLRLLGRALSTNLTIASDGSSSTILLEDWRPIFDKFDREVDGKQVPCVVCRVCLEIILMIVRMGKFLLKNS